MRFVKTAENLFGLPQGFTRVEYLQSSGAQWIDTGYIPKPTSSYKCDFELTNITTTSGAWFCVFGSVESNNVIFTELFLSRASGGGNVNQVVVGNHNSTYIRKDYAWAVNTPYDFEMTTTDVSINGVSQGSITVDSSVSCSHSIYLFARHENNDAVRYNVKAKIRSFKVYENNNLVRDFIPCIDPLGISCMYDLVGKKPYYNQGTGTFTAGRQIIPVEYLGNNGTQYIDTGVGGDLTTELTCEAAIVQAGYGSVTNIMGNNVTNTRAITINMSANIENPFVSRIRFGNTDNTTVAGAINLNTFYKYDTNKNELTVRDSSGTILNTYAFNATTAFTTNGNILIYKLGDTSTQYIGKIKVKGATIKNSGVLVRDYIPCKDENNVGFMFDKVSSTVYLNAGTGAFVVGENKYKTKLRLIREVGGVPAGCTEVEYLQSDGNQYIDMGVGVKSNTVFKATFSIASTSTGRSYFGARNSSNERFQIVNSIGIGGGYYLAGSVYPVANKKYEIEMHASGDMYLDGVKRNASTGTFSQVAFERNLWLFATNYYDSSVPPGASTFWKVQVLEGDTLVRDFIPVLDNSGRPAMYDQVSGQLFYNQGTGEFTYGRQIIPVEYLESTGAQWIDTGFVPTNTSGYKLKFSCGQTSNSVVFGCRSSSGQKARWWTGDNNGTYNGFVSNETNRTPYTFNTIRTVENNFYNSRTRKVDGVVSQAISETITDTMPSSHMFSNIPGSTTSSTQSRIYQLLITDNDTLTRNFIPAIDENGVGYMFDRVTHSCYLNKGTGSFISGRPVCKVRFVQDIVPREYAIVNYIESTGTQYIDTGILSKQSLKIKAKFNGKNVTVSQFAYGVRKDTATITYATYGNSTDGWSRWGKSAHAKSGLLGLVEVEQDSSGTKVNGTTYTYDSAQTVTTQSGYTITIFAGRNSTSGVTNNLEGEFYYFQIYDNGALVRNFIPVLRRIDKVAGMWDTITKQFFTNSGTGNFNYG